MDCRIMKRLAPIIVRFHFNIYRFIFIGVNDQFVEVFKYDRSQRISQIEFKKCVFAQTFSDQSKRRFISWLIEAQPGELDLDFPRAN
ncbi:hypothetical protein PMAYCL1PPCAC_01784, partial [Pristionchus mayeri]